MIIIRYLNFCDHLKEIKSEFHGQRMLQIVVTEYHNSLKSHKYIPFLAGAQITMLQNPVKTGRMVTRWIRQMLFIVDHLVNQRRKFAA